jgi:hypothetical protein
MKYGIKATYYYYEGTLNAPQSGTMDGLNFETLQSAIDYLTGGDYDFPALEHCSGATFSRLGQYVCAHGEYERPDYEIVNLATGKSNKALRSLVESLV